MDQNPPSRPSKPAQSRTSRQEREAAMLAEARAELDRGEGISGDAVWAMIDAFARGEPLPPLPPKR